MLRKIHVRWSSLATCAMIISPVCGISWHGTYCGWEHSPIITPWQNSFIRQLKPVILRKKGSQQWWWPGSKWGLQT